MHPVLKNILVPPLMAKCMHDHYEKDLHNLHYCSRIKTSQQHCSCLTQDTHSPRSFSAILFLPILSKASARCPASAPLPTCSFHTIRSALALSRLWLYSSSRLRIFAAAILSFGPNSRQQVPTSSLMSDSCNSVTTDFLGSLVSCIRERKKSYFHMKTRITN